MKLSHRKDRTRLDVLDAWADIARKANISWFIHVGTLLGSYRHHQMIPWDHDLDVCVRRNDWNRVLAAYEKYLNKAKFYYKVHRNVM